VGVYLASVIFVVLAEMGDKTQLLAMAFASRYRWQTVLWGVFVATLVNHFLAVVAGSYLTKFVPIQYIQIAASASFILFGLWTIRGDTLEGEDKRFNFSPFWTVAVAFFFAEMGDKTQLATVALATKYSNILVVWLGTTTAMIIADGQEDPRTIRQMVCRRHLHALWCHRPLSVPAKKPADTAGNNGGAHAHRPSHHARRPNEQERIRVYPAGKRVCAQARKRAHALKTLFRSILFAFARLPLQADPLGA
jgi:putative Ca2+/H+ antiporter (TMEM165/GDT1 family)